MAQAPASGSAASPAAAPPSARIVAPKGIKAAITAASAAEGSGRLTEAREILEGILATEPRNLDALVRLARVFRSLNEVEQAKRTALLALGVKSNEPKAYLTLARIAEAEGKRALAISYWEKIPPGDSAYRERLTKVGRLLLAQERPDDAFAALSEAVKLWPHEVACREAMIRFAIDCGEPELAREHHAALLEIRKGQGSASPPTCRVRSRAEAVMLRHAPALLHCDNPVVLAIGPRLLDSMLALPLISGLATHFGAPIDILAPAGSPYAKLLSTATPHVRRVATPEFAYEAAFQLPEFALDPGATAPQATLNYNFAEMEPLRDSRPAARATAYANWIANLLGVLELPVAPVQLAPSRAQRGEAGRRILLASHTGHDEWPGFQHLASLLEPHKTDVVRLSAVEPTEAELTGLLDAMAGADILVCSDSAVALLGTALGLEVAFIGTPLSADLVRERIPGATILTSRDGDGSPLQPEERWRAITRAGELLQGISPQAVMKAVVALLERRPPSGMNTSPPLTVAA